MQLFLVIAELAKRSPIIIQNSSNPPSRKNLDLRPYDHATDRTRCYFSHAWSTVPRSHQRHGFVQQSSGQCTELQVGRLGFQSWPGQGVMPLRRAGKKMRARLLGLAKSIYQILHVVLPFVSLLFSISFLLLFHVCVITCNLIWLNFTKTACNSLQSGYGSQPKGNSLSYPWWVDNIPPIRSPEGIHHMFGESRILVVFFYHNYDYLLFVH